MAKCRNYTPINKHKYSGSYPIVMRSSWEEYFARNYCDLNPSCLDWASEPLKIPYRDPTTGRQTIYIPDFIMSFQSTEGRIKTALIEIKPLHEALQEHARGVKDAIQITRNLAKWEAAIGWCQRRGGVEFIVLTEAELFAGGENITAPRRKSKRRIKKS